MLTKFNNYFLPYQRRLILDTSKVICVEKSRRVGYTYAASFWGIRKCLKYNLDVSYVSSSQIAAKEFLNYVKVWLELMNLTAPGFIDLDAITSSEAILPNGHKIVALSSNPTALRGRSGSVILDEISFADNPEALMQAAIPVTTWGGSILAISSVGSPENYYYKLCREAELGKPGYSLHRTTIYDAINEGLAEKIPGSHKKLQDQDERRKAFLDALRESCASDEAFNTEYACEPAKFTQLISQDQYDKCILNNEILDAIDNTVEYNPLYIGIDIARKNDLTCIYVLEEGIDQEAEEYKQRVYRTIAVRTIKGTPFNTQLEIVDQFISHPCVAGVAIDATGIGMQFAETMREKHGQLVEPFIISAPKKAQLIERFMKYITQERVSLPSDAELMADILCIKRVSTRTGQISYNGSSKIGHGDVAIALSLALHAAESNLQISMR